MPKPERHVLVCMSSRPPGHPRGSCGSVGANDVLSRFQQEFEAKNLFDKVLVSGSTFLALANVWHDLIDNGDGQLIAQQVTQQPAGMEKRS